MMMNVNKASPPYQLNITNPPSTPNFMASPHGISTWKDEKTGNVARATHEKGLSANCGQRRP